jgi:hypothetical protein
VRGNVTAENDTLTNASAQVNLIPAQATGTPDVAVTIDDTGELTAGAQPVLTFDTVAGDVLPIQVNDPIKITADDPANGAQFLSSSDFASSDTTLEVPFSDSEPGDEDPGVQIPFSIFGPCTNDVSPVTVMVQDECGINVMAEAPIEDIQPDDPAKLAVVDISDGQDTDSDLDDADGDLPDKFEGTAPVVFDLPVLGGVPLEDILTSPTNTLLDTFDGGCDTQLWDQYNNLDDEAPPIACSAQSGLATFDINGCTVAVVYPEAAIGTTDTISCEYDDTIAVPARTFEIDITKELEGNDATGLEIILEGPQNQDGTQNNNSIPVGESIIRIGANGVLEDPIGVQINLSGLEGAQLRDLDGVSRTTPFTITLDSGEQERWVIYAPAAGTVTVTVTDQAAEPIAEAEEPLSFFDVEPVTVTVTCDDPTELCPSEDEEL